MSHDSATASFKFTLVPREHDLKLYYLFRLLWWSCIHSDSFIICSSSLLQCFNSLCTYLFSIICPRIGSCLWKKLYLFNSVTEKAMALHSSSLVWKIPWMEEPGGLQSMGPLRVGHNWATSLSLFTFMHWRKKWQPTPVFLPGESQGQGSLVGCRLWGRTESDMTEAT